MEWCVKLSFSPALCRSAFVQERRQLLPSARAHVEDSVQWLSFFGLAYEI